MSEQFKYHIIDDLFDCLVFDQKYNITYSIFISKLMNNTSFNDKGYGNNSI